MVCSSKSKNAGLRQWIERDYLGIEPSLSLPRKDAVPMS